MCCLQMQQETTETLYTTTLWCLHNLCFGHPRQLSHDVACTQPNHPQLHCISPRSWLFKPLLPTWIIYYSTTLPLYSSLPVEKRFHHSSSRSIHGSTGDAVSLSQLPSPLIFLALRSASLSIWSETASCCHTTTQNMWRPPPSLSLQRNLWFSRLYMFAKLHVCWYYLE